MMRSEFKRFGKGFVYAWNGIRAAVREERNFRFHLCAAVFVYMAAALAEISREERQQIMDDAVAAQPLSE